MGIKPTLTFCLTALSPVFSYAAIRSDILLTWLGLVDFLLLSAIVVALPLPAFGQEETVRRLWPSMAGMTLCGLLFSFQPEGEMVYFSPVGISLILVGLLTTLASGQEPLITRLARRKQRGELSDELRIYTRKLTWVWVLFFCLLVMESVLLTSSAPVQALLFFANVVHYTVVGGFFLTEYISRHIRYRHHSQPSIPHRIATITRSSVIAAPRN